MFKFSPQLLDPFSRNRSLNFGHGGYVCAQFFFQENGTSYRCVHMTVKRSCLVVPTYHKKKFGKSRISAGEIPKLLRQDLVANPIYPVISTPVLGKWKVNYLIRRFELYGSDRLDFGVVG